MIDLLFKNLTEAEESMIEQKLYEPDTFLINQGNLPVHIFIVKKGIVKASHINENGQEYLIGLFGENEIFGDMEFFTGSKYFNSVKTIRECDIIKIPNDVFKSIVERNKGFAFELFNIISKRLEKITSRNVEQSYYSVEYLIIKFLINEANEKLEINSITKENLANYFGVNIRSINRGLKKFLDENLIEFQKDKIKILNLEVLKKSYLSIS